MQTSLTATHRPLNQGLLSFQETELNSHSLVQVWCHSCKLQFSLPLKPRNNIISCIKCQSDFCQELQATSQSFKEHPKHFIIPKVAKPNLAIPSTSLEEMKNQDSDVTTRENQQLTDRENHLITNLEHPFLQLEEEDQASYNRRRNSESYRQLSRTLDLFIDTVADYAVLHGRSSPGFLVRNGNRVLSLMGKTSQEKREQSIQKSKEIGQLIGYYGQGPSNLFGFDLNNFINEDSDSEESNIFDSILQFLIDNDPNRFGPPPASNVAVSALNLKEIQDSKEISSECTVCQEEFKIGDKFITMPCQHNFHQDCLMPWLKERNSCPTCRFELPTDDEDYEAKKHAQHV